MMTSNDVGEMFAGQQAAFADQNNFARQIGIAPMSSGLHGFGAARSPSSAGFNYGSSGMFSPQYGSGNRFASAALSGLGGMATFAGGALGVGSMLGGMGIRGPMGAFAGLSRVAPLVDPFSAFGAARSAGLGVAGGLGAAMLPIGLGMAASSVVNHWVQGGQQQGAINQTLGQNYNMFNPNSRTGMGFSRDDGQQIGGMVRQLAAIPEMMTSVQELTGIMGRLKNVGSMQGIKDAGEFQKRFKEAISTIKNVAETIGTTLDEASAFFQHSSGVGLHGRVAQLKNALNVQMTSGLTGMSTGQVMGMQQAGADMATQIGARRGSGTRAVTNLAQAIGSAQRNGSLSSELLQDVTGLEGPEAVQAASQQLAGGMLRLAQTAPGQLALAGMMKLDANGRAMLDRDKLQQFERGELTMSDLKRHASRLTRAEKISFKARQGDLAMELAGSAGGMSRFVGGLVEGKYGDEASTLLMERYGLNAGTADLMKGLRGAGGSQDMETFARIRGRENEVRQRTDPDAIWKRVKTRMHESMFGGIERSGAKIYTEIGKAYDEFIDDMVGRHIIKVSKEGADDFTRAMSGGGKDQLRKLFAGVTDISDDERRRLSNASSFTTGKLFASMITGGTIALTGGGSTIPSLAIHGAIRDSIDNSFMGGNVFDTMGADLARRTIGEGEYGYNQATRVSRTAELLGDPGDSKEAQSRRDVLKGLAAQGGFGMYAEDSRRHVIDDVGFEKFAGMSGFEKNMRIRDAMQRKLDYDLSGAFGRGANALVGGFRNQANAEDILDRFSNGDLDQLEKSGDEKQRDAAIAMKKIRSLKGALPQGMDAYTAFITGAIGNDGKVMGIDVDDLQSGEGNYNAVGAAESLRRGQDKALGKFSEEAQGIIKDDSNTDLRRALKVGLANTDVKRAITDLNVGEMRKRGFKLDEGDLKRLRGVLDELNEKNKDTGGGVFDVIRDYEKARKTEDFVAIASRAKEFAGDLGDVAGRKGNIVGKELGDVASALGNVDPNNVRKSKEAFAQANDAMTKLIDKVVGLSKTDQEKAVANSGSLSPALQRVLQAGQLKDGKTTVDAVLQKLNLGNDDIARSQIMEAMGSGGVGKNGEINLTKTSITEIQKRIGRMEGSRDIAKAGDSVTGTTDPLQRTLKQISENQSLTATILMTIAKGQGYADDQTVKTWQNMQRETNHGSGGAANPGGK